MTDCVDSIKGRRRVAEWWRDVYEEGTRTGGFVPSKTCRAKLDRDCTILDEKCRHDRLLDVTHKDFSDLRLHRRD